MARRPSFGWSIAVLQTASDRAQHSAGWEHFLGHLVARATGAVQQDGEGERP